MTNENSEITQKLRITQGTPRAQDIVQKGLFDRYLMPVNESHELIEVLPLDTSCYRWTEGDKALLLHVDGMPWYYVGWSKDGFANVSAKDAIALANDTYQRIVSLATQRNSDEGVTFDFDLEEFEQEMSRFERLFNKRIMLEKAPGLALREYGLCITGGEESGNIPAFTDKVIFHGEDVHGILQYDVTKVESLHIRNSKQFDFKLRTACYWLLETLYPKGYSAVDVMRFSLYLRILGAEVASNALSKVMCNMSSDNITKEVVCAVAVFERMVKILVDGYAQVVDLRTDSYVKIRAKYLNQIGEMNDPALLKYYTSGFWDLSGKGALKYGWLVAGSKHKLEGGMRLGVVYTDDADIKTGNFEKGGDIVLSKSVIKEPVVLGNPVSFTGDLLTYEELADADLYPFTLMPRGGVIEHVPKSRHSAKDATLTFFMPKNRPHPVYSNDSAGMLKSIIAGNVSVLSGDSSICVSSCVMDKDGWTMGKQESGEDAS